MPKLDNTCPLCGYVTTDTINQMGDESVMPEKGDISICVNCTNLNYFNAELKLEPITPEVWAAVSEVNQKGIKDLLSKLRAHKEELC